jgi:hypothetical protein
MKFSSNKERYAVITGVCIVCILLLYASISQFYHSTSLDAAYQNTLAKKKVLSQMRIHFLKSVEMEKNAVMAITDEDSEAFANQSRAASNLVAEDLKAFDELNSKVPLHDERKLISEFSECWEESRKLDQSILEIAVQNTNLKAAKLVRENGSEKIQYFQQLLENILQKHSNESDEGRLAALVYRAIAAALRFHALHGPHIDASDDSSMDQIETQMKKEEENTEKALDELAQMVDQDEQGVVSDARLAFSGYLEISQKAVQLSRKNSNIKSLELSLGKKRTIAAQCDALLASLQEIVQEKTFKARK